MLISFVSYTKTLIFPLKRFVGQQISNFKKIYKKNIFKRKKKNEKVYTKTSTVKLSTYFYLQTETSNKKIQQFFFSEELHRESGVKCKHNVFRNAPRSFRFSAGGAGWGRERGSN